MHTDENENKEITEIDIVNTLLRMVIEMNESHNKTIKLAMKDILDRLKIIKNESAE